MPHSHATSEVDYHPMCAVLAWVWPGLGHLVRGERTRGLYLMFGVLFLFLTGILIGGVDSVDRKEDKLWFVAQACCGPIALVADYANQSLLKTGRVGDIITSQPVPINEKKSLGRANEYGTLFSALAGLMNLVVILDALHRRPRAIVDRRKSNSEATAAPVSAAAEEAGNA